MKRKYRYGYKIVRVRSSWKVPPVLDSLTLHSSKRYGFNITTRPNWRDGPLTVFNTLEDAKRFRRDYVQNTCPIYRCRYIASKKKHDTYKIWTDTRNGAYGLTRSKLPKGTRLADEVTLTYLAVAGETLEGI